MFLMLNSDKDVGWPIFWIFGSWYHIILALNKFVLPNIDLFLFLMMDHIMSTN